MNTDCPNCNTKLRFKDIWFIAANGFQVKCGSCGYIHKITGQAYANGWLISALSGFIAILLFYIATRALGDIRTSNEWIEILGALIVLTSIAVLLVRTYVYVLYRYINNSFDER